MSLRSLMRDSVTLVKPDGQRFEGIHASVQRNKIFTDDSSIPIEEGDVFERSLPSGTLERYTVVDAGYQQGIGSIQSHYQSTVRKQTKIDIPGPAPNVTYNLSGPNARLNVQSVDASANVVQGETTEAFFERLRTTIAQSINDEPLAGELSRKVDELQRSHGKPEFLTRYQEFMALAANHLTILAPFIQPLTQMFG